MKFDAAYKHLRSLGIDLTACSGEYAVNYRKGHLNTRQITDDLSTAVQLGEAMAKNPPPKPPLPMGPLGRRSQRGLIIRHNRKIAALRAKAQQDG